MAREYTASSAWNDKCYGRQDALDGRGYGWATPLRQAMDPEGTLVARKLLLSYSAKPQNSQRGLAYTMRSTVPGFDASQGSGTSMCLVSERERRRQSIKSHLVNVLQTAVNARYEISTMFLTEGRRPTGANAGTTQQGPSTKYDQVLKSEEQQELTENDGGTSTLKASMISHLGPLGDLAELDLSVEGLSSAPLLRQCTSLKSLALNVNRFSSPAHLVASTGLVRLGLRRVKFLLHNPRNCALLFPINQGISSCSHRSTPLSRRISSVVKFPSCQLRHGLVTNA